MNATESVPSPGATAGWIIAAIKVPAQPSRHRVAVWRELRKIGAAPVAQGVWTVPDVPVCAEALSRVAALAAEGDGDVLLLSSRGRTPADEAKLARLFAAARTDDWSEFIADCAKFEAEIDREIAIDKLTMAELEEEEQSLDRLRRWHHDLKKRDVFGVPAGAEALIRLRRCGARLEEYADLVYERVQQP
ncbi:chromate resistance protein ChrB [Microbacteriaceae bacterium VKM Ac-2855]|nr:chromate resistance protein ChrB [Microbacteriaceae bacterium VKM Ac-2855]